jgi:hypothetical protein
MASAGGRYLLGSPAMAKQVLLKDKPQRRAGQWKGRKVLDRR